MIAGRASLIRDLDRWFLPVFPEPCCCGKDIRHRLMDEIFAALDTGATISQAAKARGLPRAAVEAVVLEWDRERGRPKEAG